MKFLLFLCFFTFFSYAQTTKIVARKACQVTESCPDHSSGPGLEWSGIKIYDWGDHDSNPGTIDTLGWSSCTKATAANSGSASVVKVDNCPCDPNFTKTPSSCLEQTSCACQCNRNCTGNFRRDSNTCSCICPYSQADCDLFNSLFDSDTCSCSCTISSCPGSAVLDEYNCTCNCTLSCDDGFTLNRDACTCDPDEPDCTPGVCTPSKVCPVSGITIQGDFNSGINECDSSGNVSTVCTGGTYSTDCSTPPPEEPDPECTSDSGCTGTCEKCINNTCQVDHTDCCISSDDCGDCEICNRDNQCVSDDNCGPPPQCTSHSQCPGVCNKCGADGQCQIDSSCCTSDSSCPGTCNKCKNNTCQIDSSCCTSDSSCPGTCNKCKNNTCQIDSSCCTYDSQCSGICNECSGNSCQPKSNCCVSDSQCGTCEKCEGNKCKKKSDCCTSNNECSGDCMECRNHQCESTQQNCNAGQIPDGDCGCMTKPTLLPGACDCGECYDKVGENSCRFKSPAPAGCGSTPIVNIKPCNPH